MVVGGIILNVIITLVMIKSVIVIKIGVVLGFFMVINFFIRIVFLIMGSIMYKNYGWFLIGFLGFVVNVVVVLFLFYYGKDLF